MALQQLDELAGRHVEGLRALTKTIQDARLRRDNDSIRAAIQQYDDALERYMPGGCTDVIAHAASAAMVNHWFTLWQKVTHDVHRIMPTPAAAVHARVSLQCSWQWAPSSGSRARTVDWSSCSGRALSFAANTMRGS